jgi:hypothetical protein
MKHFLDISVKGAIPPFTRRAHEFGVQTQILMKVPKWNLTTVRLIGTNWEITEFLKGECARISSDWTMAKVQMHVNAIKLLTPDGEAPTWKNRWLAENRAKALP